MRRQVRSLQAELKKLVKQVGKLQSIAAREEAVPPADEAEVVKTRFSSRSLKALRRRFELTQGELAKLLDVSPTTITSWQRGKSRPRKDRLARIATLRKMTRAQVDEALGRPAAPPVKPARIKALRKKLGLSQAALARALGVSTGSVAGWESGKNPVPRQRRGPLMELLRKRPKEPAPKAAPAPSKKSSKHVKTLSPEQIRKLRADAGLSRKALAEKIGVSANSIYNWETGRSAPKPASVEKLLAALKS